MAVLLLALGCLTIAFALHLILWRLRLPRYQTRALLLLFFGAPIVFIGGLVMFVPAARAVLAGLGLAAYCQIALFVVSFALAYIITYSAVEVDSPSLVMVRAIAGAGAAGLPEKEFVASVSDEVLVKPRVADLVRDGMIRPDADGYQITAKGRRFVGIFIRFRQVMGAGKGG